MKSTRIRREQATLIRLALPRSASIFFKVGVISPISCPDSSTLSTCTREASSGACVESSKPKPFDTSLTTDSGCCVVWLPEPLMRTSHCDGSHDGGETSYVTQ